MVLHMVSVLRLQGMIFEGLCRSLCMSPERFVIEFGSNVSIFYFHLLFCKSAQLNQGFVMF